MYFKTFSFSFFQVRVVELSYLPRKIPYFQQTASDDLNSLYLAKIRKIHHVSTILSALEQSPTQLVERL